jgi:acyl transferase domain-containing protein
MLEVDEFARHMRHPHRPVAGIQFHSAGSAAPLDSDVERTAATLAQMSCRQLDFVGLVGRVYAAGARVFIEVGPGATTTRLIQAALRGRPHLAVSISRRGQDDQSAWLRALAILVTHRVPVDLGALARA